MALGIDMVSFLAMVKLKQIAPPKELKCHKYIYERGPPNRKTNLPLNSSFL